MKKFCSKCGTQLDLSKKSCTVCHAFNPYFISGFSENLHRETEVKPVVNVDIAALRAEEAKQNELHAAELQQRQKERELLELSLKNELNKVKEETEQYKKETRDLVKGVQKELHDIEKENQLLKEKVELLKTTSAHEDKQVAAGPLYQSEPEIKTDKKNLAVAAIVLLLLATGASYFFFSRHNVPAPAPTVNSQQPAKTEVAKTESIAPAVKDTVHTHKLIAAAIPAPAVVKPAAINPANVTSVVKPNAGVFSLTNNKVIADLVGKKLSGCDITITSSSEIEYVNNLALVEKLSSSYLKYKCTIKIKQGNDVFTSSPYIYYSAEGTFIKVDGTNCE